MKQISGYSVIPQEVLMNSVLDFEWGATFMDSNLTFIVPKKSRVKIART